MHYMRLSHENKIDTTKQNWVLYQVYQFRALAAITKSIWYQLKWIFVHPIPFFISRVIFFAVTQSILYQITWVFVHGEY